MASKDKTEQTKAEQEKAVEKAQNVETKPTGPSPGAVVTADQQVDEPALEGHVGPVVKADADPDAVAEAHKAALAAVGPDVGVEVNPHIGSAFVTIPSFLGGEDREFKRGRIDFMSADEWSAFRNSTQNRDRDGRQMIVKEGSR